MATKKIYDLAVKVGEYQKDGETKSKYENIGLVLEKDDGGRFLMLKRTFNPAGVPNFSGKDSENILISMFEPKEDGQQQRSPAPAPARAPAPASGGGVDIDDIPFAPIKGGYSV